MAGVFLALSTASHAQDRPADLDNPPKDSAQTEKPKPSSTETSSPKKLDQAALEKEFREMLTCATLKGSWQMTNAEGLAGKAPLGEARVDSYEISSANKLAGDRWIISARIQYADKDVTIPVPVRVVWAEDTAIITLDTMNLPGLGSYSARVMIFRGFYAGTWFGKNYGGVMSGQIVKTAATTQPADKSEKKEKPAEEKKAK